VLDNLMQTFLKDGNVSAAELQTYNRVRTAMAQTPAADAAPPTAAAPDTPPAPETAAPNTGRRAQQRAQKATPDAEPAAPAAENQPVNPNPTWRELVETLERELGPTAPAAGPVAPAAGPLSRGRKRRGSEKRGGAAGMWEKKKAALDMPRGRISVAAALFAGRGLNSLFSRGSGLSSPRRSGSGKSDSSSSNSVGDMDAFSTTFWGPNTTKMLRAAYEALQSGDISSAKEHYSGGKSTASPVMLDLNGDGKLGTTGVSTAKERVDGQVGKTVNFDIDGDGKKDKIEWMDGQGDGMLVDDRDGGASRAAASDGEIDGTRLYGDQGGKFDNGYTKLAQHDANQDGKLTGDELQGLKTWVDDGDAKVEAGELKTLEELGITEISVEMNLEKNARGEDLMRSSFVQNGENKVTEDVWFAKR
jgi:hypothetical protein